MRVTEPINQRGREPAARAVAANRYVRCRETLAAQKTPGGECIIEGCREWMLGGQTITYGESPYSCCAAGL